MNKEKFVEGLKTAGTGFVCVLGAVAVGALSVMSAGIEAEKEEKYGESFKDVMTAITNSDISGYYQKKIIEVIVTKELTSRQMESIITICGTDMNYYDKYTTIMKIVE